MTKLIKNVLGGNEVIKEFEVFDNIITEEFIHTPESHYIYLFGLPYTKTNGTPSSEKRGVLISILIEEGYKNIDKTKEELEDVLDRLIENNFELAHQTYDCKGRPIKLYDKGIDLEKLTWFVSGDYNFGLIKREILTNLHEEKNGIEIKLKNSFEEVLNNKKYDLNKEIYSILCPIKHSKNTDLVNVREYILLDPIHSIISLFLTITYDNGYAIKEKKGFITGYVYENGFKRASR